MTSYVIIR